MRRHLPKLAQAAAAVLLVLALPATRAFAVKAYPFPTQVRQPDGTTITVRMFGDERIVFYEDLEGYTVVRNAKGWWTYANPASHGKSSLAPSGNRVGRDTPPPGWMKHVRPRINPGAFRIPWNQSDDGSVAEAFRRWRSGSHAPSSAGISVSAMAASTPLGVPVLIIPIEFSDLAHTSGPDTPIAGEPDYQPIPGQPNTAATWQQLFGDRSVAGGLNHYYWEASYGQFQWDVEVAACDPALHAAGACNDGWYVEGHTMKYWGEDKSQGASCYNDAVNSIKDLVEWAIKAAEPDVDYAAYDTDGNGSISDAELMIFVIHARDGQENYGDGCGTNPADPLNDHLWSHKWNIDTNVTVDGKTVPNGHVYSINPEFQPALSFNGTSYDVTDKWFGVGVYAHEAFHTLGAPDLYDYDYDADVAGEWDLMDAGSYNGAKSGTHPSHMGTPLKEDIPLSTNPPASYGWIMETDVVDVTAGGSGVYQVPALSGSSPAHVLHRLTSPNQTSERFLVENRQPIGYYEPYLPEYGLVIWHRDLTGSRDDWPYRAAVEREGWANTADGLLAYSGAAAFSLDDGQTAFTSATDPANTLNDTGSPSSGLLDVACVSAEATTMSFAYGSISGANPYLAGAAVSGGTDDDPFIDNGETASVTVSVGNSSCAATAAAGVRVTLSVAADSDVPASAVTISPASVSLGDLAAGASADASFTAGLACDAGNYFDRSITFTVTISSDSSSFTTVTSGFVEKTDLDYLWFDDAEGGVTGWTNSGVDPSTGCTSTTNNGAWDWQSPTDRVHSGSRAYHTPEETTDACFTSPEEIWTSPTITIPAGVTVKELDFWQAAGIPMPGSSRGRIFVSGDGGSSWTRLTYFKDGGALTWEHTRVPLSEFAGASQLKIEFTMYTYACWTDPADATEGWYLDDIGLVVDEQDGCPCVGTPDLSGTATAADVDTCSAGISVSWSDVSDWGDSGGSRSIEVLRSPDGSSWTSCGTDADLTSPFVDTGATAGVATFYRVVATNGCGMSASVETAVGVVDAVEGPLFAGVASAADADGCTADGITVAWSTPGDWNDGCASSCSRSFAVHRHDGTSETTVATGLPESATSYLDATASANTPYTYRVEATNDTGCGNDGGATAAATDTAAGPPAFAGLATAADSGCDGVTLSWSAPSDWNDGGYRQALRYFTVLRDGTVIGGAAADAVGFVDREAPLGASSTYAVRAANACGGASGASVTRTATNADDAPAPTFAGLTSATAAAGGTCRVDLAWSAATAACGSEVAYNVYRSTDPGFTPSGASRIATGLSTTSFADSVLDTGVTYYYVVRAEELTDGTGPGGGVEETNTVVRSAETGATGTVVSTVFADGFEGTSTPASHSWIYAYFSDATGDGVAWTTSATNRVDAGTYAARFGNGTSYPAYSDDAIIAGDFDGDTATSEGILLPSGADAITLTYRMWRAFQVTSKYRDGAMLMVSTTSVLDGYSQVPDADPGTGAYIVSPAYSGSLANSCPPSSATGGPEVWGGSADWTTVTVDLTRLAGQRIWLAWRAISDCLVSAEGLYVDSVLIQSSAESAGPCDDTPSDPTVATATASAGGVKVEWLNADDACADHVVVVRGATEPADPADGDVICAAAPGTPGAHATCFDAAPPAGASYYAAFTVNGSGAASAGLATTARPSTETVERWSYSTGASALVPPGFRYGTIGTGAVLAVSNDRRMHGVNADDWTDAVSPSTANNSGEWLASGPYDFHPTVLNGAVQHRPAVVPLSVTAHGEDADTVAYLGALDGYVYAVDVESGEVIWRSSQLGDMVQAPPALFMSAYGMPFDLLLVGTRNAASDNAIVALDPRDGSTVWTFDNGGGASGIGIVTGAYLDYATGHYLFTSRARDGGSDHTVWCLQVTPGGAVREWSAALGDIDVSPMLWDDTVYVGTVSGVVHAVDPVTGSLRWSFDPADHGGTGGAVNGVVIPRYGTAERYFSTTNEIWGIVDEGTTATLRTGWPVTAVTTPSAPLVRFGTTMLYVGTGDGALAEVDMDTRAVVTVTLGAGTGAVSTPGLDAANGLIYVGTESGKVFAVTLPLQ